MTPHTHSILAIVAALGLSVAVAGPAAAQQGTTSGPAVGGNVQPSATTQKQKGGHDAKQNAQQPGGGSVSTGGVGVEAKQGSESGPAPGGKPAPH